MSEHDHHNHEPHGEITVETLSTPPLRMKPAPLGRRIAAGIIDSLIIGLVWTILGIASHQDLATVTRNYWPLTSLAFLTFVYYFVLEWISSATVGKALLKLIVVDKDGDTCSIGASLKRNLLRFIDWLPLLYIARTVVVLVSSDRQRIGDLIARTTVTKTPEKDINPPPAPFLFH